MKSKVLKWCHEVYNWSLTVTLLTKLLRFGVSSVVFVPKLVVVTWSEKGNVIKFFTPFVEMQPVKLVCHWHYWHLSPQQGNIPLGQNFADVKVNLIDYREFHELSQDCMVRSTWMLRTRQTYGEFHELSQDCHTYLQEDLLLWIIIIQFLFYCCHLLPWQPFTTVMLTSQKLNNNFGFLPMNIIY